MPRIATNPLPQFITSPDLGVMIAAELRSHADHESKQLVGTFADIGERLDALSQVRIQMIHNAADQLDRYCEEAASAR